MTTYQGVRRFRLVSSHAPCKIAAWHPLSNKRLLIGIENATYTYR